MRSLSWANIGFNIGFFNEREPGRFVWCWRWLVLAAYSGCNFDIRSVTYVIRLPTNYSRNLLYSTTGLVIYTAITYNSHFSTPMFDTFTSLKSSNLAPIVCMYVCTCTFPSLEFRNPDEYKLQSKV